MRTFNLRKKRAVWINLVDNMEMKDLRRKKITVMGLGQHGGALGNIQWLAKQEAHLTVTDMKQKKDLTASLEKLKDYPGITYVLGHHRDEDFTAADIVIRNPAVPRKSQFLEKARSAGVSVEMDSSLFFKLSPSTNIIGVTGSKGKTTTTNAIAHILKQHFPQAVAIGIEGTAPLPELEVIHKEDPVVFELSSWRLEALDEYKLSPKIAVFTSIYRDHLNTYASFEDYVETKKTIFKYQKPSDICLLNADDPTIQTWEKEVPSTLYWYSVHELPASKAGIYIHDGSIMVRSPQLFDGKPTPLFTADTIPLLSHHERRNVLPGILIGLLLGIETEKIHESLATLKALPHRLEIVRELKGVKYINDSAATIPDATIAALEALHGKRIVHILGGSDKELLFDDLAQAETRATIRTLIFLPGTATERMKQAIVAQHSQYAITDAVSMSDAVQQAYTAAQPGDVVLLSPGATSFGLFKHEFDRGNQFRKAVLALKVV